jgi:DNA-binding SARP family transcriptional activator
LQNNLTAAEYTFAVQFQILGPLAVHIDGVPLRLGSPAQRRVLAALLLRRNETVPRAVLISEVWHADAEVFDEWELADLKRGALFTYIARLRGVLAPVARRAGREALLHTVDNGYRLEIEDKYVDETEFTALVRGGHDELDAGRPAFALRHLEPALALWRGRPLGELHDEPFAQATVARLEAVRLDAVEAWAETLLDLGRHRDLIADPQLRGHLDQYPASERLHHAYAVTLHRCGQTAAALAACRAGTDVLTRLGVHPAALHRLAGDLSGPVPAAPPPAPASAAPAPDPDGLAAPPPAPASAAPAPDPDGLAAATGLLDRLVRRQWEAEVAVRQLADPRPMPVTWLPRAADVLEHAPRTDDMPGFAAAFRSLRRPRLVLLGVPGSGKTTAATLLAVELTRNRRPSDPVPVLLTLSSWQPDRVHLAQWLRAQLAEHYPALSDPGRFRAGTIAALVADRRILLILDGLDEVPGRWRPLMVKAINRTLLADDALVLTSRPDAYDELVSAGEGLSGATILQAQPLPGNEAAGYLMASAGLQRRAPVWQPVLAELADRPDAPLAVALSSPLVVMLARLVYTGPRQPAELLDTGRFPDADAVAGHLLDMLIPALLELDGHREARAGYRAPDPDAFRRRLTYLARYAHGQGTYDLTWWRLSEAVRPLAGRFGRALTAALLVLLVGVAVVVAADLPGYVASIGWRASLAHTLAQGTGHGLAFGLGTFAATLFVSGVRPGGTGEPGRGWRLPVAALRTGAAGGVSLGLAEGIFAALSGEPAGAAAITGMAYGMDLGLAFGLTAVIAAVPSPTATDLRLRGRWRGLCRALAGGLAAGALAGLGIGVVEEFALAVAGRAGAGYDRELVFGLVPGLVLGLVVGPAAALVHWARRPIVVEEARDLRSTLATDRRHYLTLVAAVTAIVMLAFTAGAAVIPGQSLAGAAGRGLGTGLAGGIVLALGFGFIAAWPRYQVAKAWLAARRRLPWRLVSFIEEAHRIGVLRRIGATYQFRHARLQDRLASPDRLPAPPGWSWWPGTSRSGRACPHRLRR